MKTRLVLLVLAVITLVVIFWMYAWQPRQLEARKQSVLAHLPSLPDFTYQNRASIETFQAADRRARENPLSSSDVGRLGMLYHAYQFTDEARGCYRLARDLAPDEFVWIYYQAVLEKAAYGFEDSEALFGRAIELRPESAELWAELGDLHLKWARRKDAVAHFEKALELDPLQPVAAIGEARLAILSRDWQRAITLLTPVLERHPRLSICHRYLARAYGSLGRTEEQAHHQSLSEYGSALESPLMAELHELSTDAILDGGDPSPGPEILELKCVRCHDRQRIDETSQDRHWWARTVRRMQREAGWAWLSDEEAASVVAYLASRSSVGNRSR